MVIKIIIGTMISSQMSDGMLILKDEDAIDVLNSGNIGHQWHDFDAIDVHATDMGEEEKEEKE
jgi:hypothetical protein